MSVFEYQKDSDGIVTVTMNMSGPVNAMNSEYDQAMAETVDRLEAEADLTGVVFASAKKTFFAGGDLKWLYSFKSGEEQQVYDYVVFGKAMLRRLEKLPVPVVAAINGAALGGGYELCLSCNHRIAWDHPGAVVGLPEVTLGLLPGAGGVVRLTYNLGVEKALPILTRGKRLSGQQALSAGLVDQLVDSAESLVPTAKQWIKDQQGNIDASTQPWDRENYQIPGGDVTHPDVAKIVADVLPNVEAKIPEMAFATGKITEIIAETVNADFDQAMEVESRGFSVLVPSADAKTLIKAFFDSLK